MPTRRTFLKTAAVSALIAGTLSAQTSEEPKEEKRPDGFYVGAVSVDITPDRPVVLPGQHYTRVSDGVRTRSKRIFSRWNPSGTA